MGKIIFLAIILLLAGCDNSVNPEYTLNTNPHWYYPDTLRV